MRAVDAFRFWRARDCIEMSSAIKVTQIKKESSGSDCCRCVWMERFSGGVVAELPISRIYGDFPDINSNSVLLEFGDLGYLSRSR